MNALQEKALFHLTGYNNLTQVKESSLKQLAAEYPYFAPVHLFLAEKWRETGAPQFEKDVQKANLYFTNPYWLHFQLSNHTDRMVAVETGISLERLTVEAHQMAKEIGWNIDLEPKLPSPILEDPLFDRNSEDEASPEIPETSQPSPPTNSNEFNIPTVEMVKEMMRGIENQSSIENTGSLPDLIIAAPSVADSIIDKTVESYDETEATELSNAKISRLLSGQLAEFNKPVTEADNLGLPKEHLHTIDYFASQGIKIDLSKIPQDKLTTHLRRFTDWLKYMKSENPNPVDLGSRQDLEAAVEIIAQSSNEPKEVLTESMADVLQKQGQIDKAIQLYIKLSFLNPEKSAYFAAKIQHLKGIQ